MALRTHSITLGLTLAAGLFVASRPVEAQRQPSLYPPAGRQPFDDWTLEAFQRLDSDRDGRIAASEWAYDREDFRRADRNGDGVLTEREFLGEDTAGVQNDSGSTADDARFADLDTNRDNRVSRREWGGDRAAFDRLDENRDGSLTRAEMAVDVASIDFGRLDADRNGVISRGEWPDSSAGFSRLDRNRDGRLTAAEFSDRGAIALSPAPSDRSPAYRAGYERGMADGRTAGREDRSRNEGWDLDGQRELEQADAGYRTDLGFRADYQAGYRAAFRIGYSDGYGPR